MSSRVHLKINFQIKVHLRSQTVCDLNDDLAIGKKKRKKKKHADYKFEYTRVRKIKIGVTWYPFKYLWTVIHLGLLCSDVELGFLRSPHTETNKAKNRIHTWESAPEDTSTFRWFEKASPVILFWWPFNLVFTWHYGANNYQTQTPILTKLYLQIKKPI